MARFYSNENFPRRAVEAVRELGHDVLTSHEAGRANKKSAIPRCWNLQRRSRGFCLRLNRKDFFDCIGLGTSSTLESLPAHKIPTPLLWLKIYMMRWGIWNLAKENSSRFFKKMEFRG